MESAHVLPVLGGGRFEVRGTLGAGGAGVVYRAYDHQLGREVALKLLRQASGRDLYRFKKEFRALADIVHPNLVTLHELHASEGDWYFTMELVEGVSFIDWVRPAATPSPARPRADILASSIHDTRLRAALVQLIDALVALHHAGKLHRDLKPSNVLVTEQGRVALLDFGLVTNLTDNHSEKLAVGTPVYMSPEQASDQPLTEASDWYSVGAMLYEALTGRRPFEGESEQVMTRKQAELPLEPRQIAPASPADLARLCMLMLQPLPGARPNGFALLGMLGAVPSLRTRDMARTATPAPFVGRTRELDDLRRALADSRLRGVAVTIKGKSGMGKTACIRRFLQAQGGSVFSLEGRCFEREQVPFKMLDGVVDTLTNAIVALPAHEAEALAPTDLGSLVRLFPVIKRVKRLGELAGRSQSPADPAELRRRGFQALRSLLGKLSRIRPVVLIIDDAQWGDADSAGFLNELIHLGDPALLTVVAHRPEDYFGVVAKLKQPQLGVRRGDVREIELRGLDDGDAFTLVGELMGDSPRVEQVVRAGIGNPLVLSELSRAPRLPPGAKVDDLVRARVSRLTAEAQAMLAVSSVAAKPIPVEIAAQAAGVARGHDVAALLSAERLATLRRVDDHMILEPAHDHVKVAVLAGLAIEAKAGWHEALARAYEDVQGEANLDTPAVVEHWLAAGHPGNAAHHAIAAAARAEEALAFRRAAELYEIALMYGLWDSAGQRDLLRAKAHALVCAGQLDEAAAIYGHAAQILPGDESIECERLRIEALLRRGRLDEAVPAAERLLRQVGVRSPFGSSRAKLAAQWMQQKLRGLDFVERQPHQLATAELRRVDVLYSIVSGLAFVDPQLGRVLQADLLRSAFDCGEPVRVCLALAQEVCYSARSGSGNVNAVRVVGAKLRSIAGRVGHPPITGLTDTALGIAAYMSGHYRDARSHLEAGLRTLRDHGAGVRWELDIAETYWLSTLYYLGEWRELIRQSQLLLRDAIERGDVVAQLGIQLGRSNLAWLIAGRPDEARVQLEAAHTSLPAGFYLPHVLWVQAACNLDLYEGNVATAVKRLDDAWGNIERIGALRTQHLRVELRFLRARLMLAQGRRTDEAARIADDLIKEGATWANGIGHLVHAALQRDRQAAFVSLLAAEQDFTATGMNGWLHIARLARGQLEGGTGGGARAEAARDLLSDLGAAFPDRFAALLVPWSA